jgi:hypothetical protein
VHIFLTLACNGGKWSVSHSGCFAPREEANGIHWTEGWVGTTTGLDAVDKRIISFPAENSTPILSFPACIPVAVINPCIYIVKHLYGGFNLSSSLEKKRNSCVSN